MSSTDDRRPQRDKERTRAAIVQAAEKAVAAHGTRVSLADIAADAGVTKSGLLHHFPSRSALVVGVAQHVVDRVLDEVNTLVDQGDDTPGAFARAYVRASTGDSPYLSEVFGPTGLAVHLGTLPRRLPWTTSCPTTPNAGTPPSRATDYPPGRALAVRHAADGVLAGMGSAYVTDKQLALVREEPLSLTRI